MYARVVRNRIQPGKVDEWFAIVRDSIVPALKEVDGFKGFVAMVDRTNERTIGYSIWETADALTASEESGDYRTQIAKLGDVVAEPPEREQYELTVLA
jgi:quinol monooxygenase YgiN